MFVDDVAASLAAPLMLRYQLIINPEFAGINWI
jgi:hypothetical protein